MQTDTTVRSLPRPAAVRPPRMPRRLRVGTIRSGARRVAGASVPRPARRGVALAVAPAACRRVAVAVAAGGGAIRRLRPADDGRRICPYDGPQPGALGAGVGGDLRRRRLACAAKDELMTHHGTADTRQAGRAHAPAAGRVGKDLLGQAVLARVVTDDRAHAPDLQVRQGRGQGGLELAELVVDLNAQGLEDPAGGVALPAGRRRHRRRHDFGQLPRGGQWPGFHDGTGDTPGQTSLSVLPEQRRQVLYRQGVDDVGGSGARRRVHTHVERPVLTE